MSFRPEVKVQGEWSSNALSFATNTEAGGYARDVFGRWTLCEEYQAVEVHDPVTHKWDTEKRELTNIASGDAHVPPIRVTL